MSLYYTQAFTSGAVCSSSTKTIIAYNNDVAIAFSSSSDVLSCQHEMISDYCDEGAGGVGIVQIDCDVGVGGAGIECL